MVRELLSHILCCPVSPEGHWNVFNRVLREDIEGHHTCNQDGTKECLEHWSGIECTFSSTHCYPPCPVNRVCNSGACCDCIQGYGGQNCTCVDRNICDPSGRHCQVSHFTLSQVLHSNVYNNKLLVRATRVLTTCTRACGPSLVSTAYAFQRNAGCN